MGENRWSLLASTDFDARDPTTHITADLDNQLARDEHVQGEAGPRYPQLLSRGADLATALTDRTRNHSGLSVCALSTNDDPPSLFTSLDTSISARFLSIHPLFPSCARVRGCYSGLLTLTWLNRLSLRWENLVWWRWGRRKRPIKAPGGHAVSGRNTSINGMAGAPLHQYAYDWLQRAGDVAEGPLADLLRLGVLGDDVVTCAVICVMMQALASVQIAFGEAADVDSANRFARRLHCRCRPQCLPSRGTSAELEREALQTSVEFVL
eukprot:Em0005g777a